LCRERNNFVPGDAMRGIAVIAPHVLVRLSDERRGKTK